jgi:hypothetical protein
MQKWVKLPCDATINTTVLFIFSHLKNYYDNLQDWSQMESFFFLVNLFNIAKVVIIHKLK